LCVWRPTALLWLALALLPCAAAPEDDFRRGQLSYNRGDVVGAMSALRPAADAGHAPSMALLAFILDRAGFDADALRWYRAASERGDAEGHAGLANFYLTGRAVAKDEKAAFGHFSKAADLGHALSIEVVAGAHLGGALGPAAAADGAQALAALERAALRNHLPSIDALAEAYRSGTRGARVDAQQADVWRTRAADLRRLRAVPTPSPKAPR
jgi:TPR repeat protein